MLEGTPDLMPPPVRVGVMDDVGDELVQAEFEVESARGRDPRPTREGSEPLEQTVGEEPRKKGMKRT